MDGREAEALASLESIAAGCLSTTEGAREVLKLAGTIARAEPDLAGRCAPLIAAGREAVGRNGVVLDNVTYLGGYADFSTEKSGRLEVKASSIDLLWSSGATTLRRSVPMDVVSRVVIEGGQTAKSKFLPVVAFGILGLAAKGTKDRTYLMAETPSGCAVYEIDSRSAAEVKAAIGQILDIAGVDWGDASNASARDRDGQSETPPAQTGDPVDQLRRLAELRDMGVVTSEEFDQAKARLLGQL
jgi:hypothetical protein